MVRQLAPESLQQLQSQLTVVVVFRPLVPETVMLYEQQYTTTPINYKTLSLQEVNPALGFMSVYQSLCLNVELRFGLPE